jgi:hypothetical protein
MASISVHASHSCLLHRLVIFSQVSPCYLPGLTDFLEAIPVQKKDLEIPYSLLLLLVKEYSIDYMKGTIGRQKTSGTCLNAGSWGIWYWNCATGKIIDPES